MSAENLSVIDESELVNCPYDIGHRMHRQRLQQHLLKCRLNHPDVVLLKCPFNQLHLVTESDYKQRVIYCDERKMVTMFKSQPSTLDKDVAHAPIECAEENWDDDDADVKE